jgi:hypothetical protein
MRKAAKLIGATATAVGALAVLADIHRGVVDAGADLVLVASLISLAHTVFGLVDDPDDVPHDESKQPWAGPPVEGGRARGRRRR